MPFFTVRGPVALPAAATTTTFNPADKSADLTLSGGNLIVTNTTPAAWNAARSIGSMTGQKRFCSFSVTNGPANASVGIATAACSLPPGGNAGFSDNEAIVFLSENVVRRNASSLANYDSWNDSGLPFVVDMAVDDAARLIWWRVNGGNWNANPAANPATGANGFDYSAMASGAIFIVASLNDASMSMTMNTGATAYTHAAPSGFGNWS